jgi:predicted amino acid-binding ACT domain protein
MRPYGDEFVVVSVGAQPDDLTEITINCPDKVGLGCDIARIVFEFSMSLVRGDLATDGRWCFVALWVRPRWFSGDAPTPSTWALLKQRLEDICPSAVSSLLPRPPPPVHLSERLMLLQVCSIDRTGLLNDVSQKLWELEFTIHKVKVSTSPEEKSINFFFITDNRNKTPWKKRWEEVMQQVKELLGSNCLHCEMSSSDPELRGLDILPPPAKVTKDLFFDESCSPFDTGSRSRRYNPRSANVVVKHDIQSPLHTLLQVTCKKRKGLLYDTLRCVKDLRFQVAHMRIATLDNGNSEISVFFLDPNGKRIEDKTKQNEICAAVYEAVENPLRIKIVSRGDDAELFVSSPIENCGRGRPRVVYDVTLALRKLDICIFQADINRHHVNEQQWEVYRFLLSEKEDFDLSCTRNRNLIIDRVQEMLIG